MRKLLSSLAIALLAALAACDHPTEPQIREAAEKTQNMLFSGPFQSSTALLQQNIKYALETSKFFPSDLIQVERDGRQERYLATVMERVYLPPPKSGGRPYTRRMLVAWDRESQRGIALASDDSESTITFPTPELVNGDSPSRLWQRIGFATQIDNNGLTGWYGSDGSLSFGLEAALGQCKFDLGNSYGFAFVEGEPKRGQVCQEVQYHVAAASVLERRNPDAEPGVLDKWTTSKQNLRLPLQQVRGTRIITQCPDIDLKHPPTIIGCMDRYNFWRQQDQFGEKSGVDLSRMTAMRQRPGVFIQHWITGSGPEIACCAQFNGPVRYTVTTPDGTVLAHGEPTSASRDSVMRNMRYFDPFVRDGSRTLIMAPGPLFYHQYTPVIVDLTILPCPPGTKRNDTPAMGNAYPDGGCYPVGN